MGDAGRAPEVDIFTTMNIDRQDGRDEQDERFLHKKLARPMIRCGFTDAQDYRTPDSQNQILFILSINANNPFK